MPKYFKQCSDLSDPCGARWCEYCTILSSTEFRSGECVFKKPDIPNVVNKIIALSDAGESYANIRIATGVTEKICKSILRLAIARGLAKKRKNKRDMPELIPLAKELRAKGLRYCDIARELKCASSTISTWGRKGYI